jgi:hypothetical protein
MNESSEKANAVEKKAVKKQLKSSQKTAPKAAKNVTMSSRMKYVAPPTNRVTRSSKRPLVAPLESTTKKKKIVQTTTTQTIPPIFSKYRRLRNRRKITAKERAENKRLPTARRMSLGQSIRRARTLKNQNRRRRSQAFNMRSQTPNRHSQTPKHNSNLSALANQLRNLKIKSQSRSRSQRH